MNHLNLDVINEGLPNLDAMEADDLDAARAEFKQVATHFRTLASYAEAKAEASRHRLAGRVDTACKLEAHAESLYSSLPEALRW